MTTYIILSVGLSIMISTIYHPMLMMSIIILQTLLICLLTWNISASAWFGYVLFLIFVGGLMVLFIYITSLAANEKFSISFPYPSSMMIWVLIFLFLIMIFFSKNINPAFLAPLNAQLMMIFSYSISPVTILIMNYLLITLVAIVKIADKMEAPLRNLIKK